LGCAPIGFEKVATQTKGAQESLQRLIFSGELLVPPVDGRMALILANLLLEVCDVFPPSSATAPLVVADALGIGTLVARVSRRTTVREHKRGVDGTLFFATETALVLPVDMFRRQV
jgi:hypothetical protein